ncbi:MAG: YeeE/YedE family protein [Rhodospirillaceae bacterium]
MPSTSASNTAPKTGSGASLPPQWVLVGSAAALLLALELWILAAGSPEAWQSTRRLMLTAVLGVVAGISLYHAAFGFTAAWRRWSEERRGVGLRAQAILFIVICLISFPLMLHGAEIGLRTGGFVFPFGLAAVLGAFLFGIGMQLGGGCGSGTLFTVGGGSTRMVITLAAFIAGSFIGTLHLPAWRSLPALAPTSLPRELGLIPALLLTIGFFALVFWLTRILERRRHGSLEPLTQPRSGAAPHAWRGPWSPLMGAVAIAVVSIVTLLLLGRPWGITSAFALWGAKFADMAGMDLAATAYWANAMAAIERPVVRDTTSVMNFGIILGAFAAAGLAGRWRPGFALRPVDILTAIAGGLLMGYGARLAGGCNIGAYLGGIISGSLHGWGWLVFGWLGSVVGIRLRHRFGL